MSKQILSREVNVHVELWSGEKHKILVGYRFCSCYGEPFQVIKEPEDENQNWVQITKWPSLSKMKMVEFYRFEDEERICTMRFAKHLVKDIFIVDELVPENDVTTASAFKRLKIEDFMEYLKDNNIVFKI